MKLVNVTGNFNLLDSMISACAATGFCHFEDTAAVMGTAKVFANINDENPYQSNRNRIIDFMAATGINPEIHDMTFQPYPDNIINEYIHTIDTEFPELREERAAVKERIKEIDEQIDSFMRFMSLDVDVKQALSGSFVKLRFGRIPFDSYSKLKSFYDNLDVLFIPCSNNSEYYWGIYAVPTSQSEEADKIFKGLFFEELTIPENAGTPRKIIEQLFEEKKPLLERLAEIEIKIEDFLKLCKDDILNIYAQLTRNYNDFELRRYSVKYRDSFIQILWIPESETSKIIETFDRINGLEYSIEEADSAGKRSPPTKLKNFKLFRPFEFYVEMFGLPNYNEIDPTVFVAVTYTIFFGIMFADVGQGLLLALIGYLLYRVKGIKLGKILIPCGISGALFGLVFGSVFGFEHALSPFYHLIGFEEKPIEIMDSIMNILMFSVVLGIAMLIAAMLANIYSSFKKRSYENVLFGANGLAGLLIFGSIALYASGILFGKTFLPLWVVAIISLVSLFFMFLKEPLGKLLFKNEHEDESFGDYILKTFFELFETLLSYVTNTVSFMRVGAFVLVHAGMMIAFFSLGEMLGGVMKYLMIIIGNVLVIALEGLLVGVQALRLQYYELFSRFFEGDGRPFTPINK